jgi:endonuclease YncB( thermonuclease family)
MRISFVGIFIFLLAIGIATTGKYVQAENISASDSINLVDNETGSSIVLRDNSVIDKVTNTSSFFRSEIIINEVELNPPGDDSGEEWIELYNPTENDVSINNLKLMTSSESAEINLPKGAIIGGGETYLIKLEKQTLSNTAEVLTLINATNKNVDRTPPLVDTSDDDRTWQRLPDGYNEWKFAAGTPNKPNGYHNPSSNATYFAYINPVAKCIRSSAGCAKGVVTRIVDADTLYVRINGKLYKVDLALTRVPAKSEQGFIEATSFTRNLCLGSEVLVDQDDKLLTSDGHIIAVVYCCDNNLNNELLNNGFATLNKVQCGTSGFASQRWAKDHGC